MTPSLSSAWWWIFVQLISMMASAPTLYEYYTDGGISSGLEALADGFFLNGKPITIYSGAIHYFRVHPSYWRDRLRKTRAAGLNAVETYVAWNVHEPEKDKFDFGNGSNDLSMFLNLYQFIEMAQQEDLFVILRPGPYICSEWDFGGMPSWLLRDPNMKVRTSYPGFTDRVKIFFDKLLPPIANLQFSKGGPIIAFQIENEYGGFGEPDTPRDKQYLNFVKTTMESNGLTELFFTSDTPSESGDKGALPGVLMTANFQNNSDLELDTLKEMQPDKPLMVMEFWTGWYDHWMEKHHVVDVEKFGSTLESIFEHNSSVNFYMFHGGTNFGFMNGANIKPGFPFYKPDVSSYDYDAPLSEAGDYTDKYDRAKELIRQDNKVITNLPAAPPNSTKKAYGNIPVSEIITYPGIVASIPPEDRVTSAEVVSMELLDINNGNGQSYGYVIYRKEMTLSEASTLKITGRVHDVAQVVVDGELQTPPLTDPQQLNGFGYWVNSDQEFSLDPKVAGSRTVDILVENFARNNFGKPEYFNQKKGLWEGPVLVDGVQQHGWEILALQMKSSWIRSLTSWAPVTTECKAPCLLRAKLQIDGTPADTFLDMSSWGKGIVFVNGFNLGRYLHLGPQKTLYVPAPFLKEGINEVIVFEQFTPAQEIKSIDHPILE